MTHLCETGILYNMRELFVYIFITYDLLSNKSYGYFWDETEA